MAELAPPPAERTDLENTNILRWEDDGGRTFEREHPAEHSAPQVTLANDRPMTLPSKEDLEGVQRR